MRTISKVFTLISLIFLGLSKISAQTGITIGPPRVYYTIGPGQSQTEKVVVTNPSKDYTLELGISIEDWEYNERGDNIVHPAGTLPTSCAAWITVQDAFFTLQPGESKEIEIQMNLPADYQYASNVPVHTAMLYVTQLNPRDGVDEEGANIRIAVRTGIKVYQRLPGPVSPAIEITDFKFLGADGNNLLALNYVNTGRIWADGVISVELLNQDDGSKVQIPDLLYYSMPGDKRIQYIQLPAELKRGNYVATAIIDYGNLQSIQIAELEFKFEGHDN